MANGMGVQFAMFLVPAAIIVCVLVMKMRRAQPVSSAVSQVPSTVETSIVLPAASIPEPSPPKPMAPAPSSVHSEINRQTQVRTPVETVTANARSNADAGTAVATAAAALPLRIDLQGAFATSGDRR